MRTLRFRITTATLMLAILLFGLNLGAWLAISRDDDGQIISEMIQDYLDDRRSEGWLQIPEENGLACTYRSHPPGMWRLEMVGRYPLSPTLLRVYSPVLASLSISVLVIMVRSGRAPSSSPRRSRRALRAIREALIATACIGLIIAGAASRPVPDGLTTELDYPTLFEGVPQTLLICADGTILQRHPTDGSDHPDFLSGTGGPIEMGGYAFNEASIEYRRDGRVVAYAGSPEHRITSPYLLRPPTLSFLELWWPVLGSSFVTILVIALEWQARDRTVRQPSAGPTPR